MTESETNRWNRPAEEISAYEWLPWVQLVARLVPHRAWDRFRDVLGVELQQLTGAIGVAVCFRAAGRPLEAEQLLGPRVSPPAELPQHLGESTREGPVVAIMIHSSLEQTAWLVFLEPGRRNLVEFMAELGPVLGELLVRTRRFGQSRRTFEEILAERSVSVPLTSSMRRERVVQALAAANASLEHLTLFVSETSGESVEVSWWDPDEGAQTREVADPDLVSRLAEAILNQTTVVLRLSAATRLSSIVEAGSETDWFCFAPVKNAGRTVGLFGVGTSTGHEGAARSLQQHTMELVKVLAQEVSSFLDRAAAREQAYLEGMAGEREQLGLNLHDSVLQNLTYLELQLGRLDQLLEQNPPKAREVLDLVRPMLTTTSKEARELALALATTGDSTDLAMLLDRTVSRFRSRFDGEVVLEVEGDTSDINPQVSAQLNWMTQEALNNIWKHAAASRIRISVRCDRRSISLEIQDNGRGFVLDESDSTRLGLRGLEQRAAQIGATVDVQSEIGQGTTVRIVVTL